MRLKCTICLGLYDKESEICALLCGHLYHVDCINHWLSTNSSCPACRTKVQRNKIIEKLFLDHEENTSNESLLYSETQSNQLADVRAEMVEKNMRIGNLEEKIKNLNVKIESKVEEVVVMETKYREERVLSQSLRKQIANMKEQQEEVKRARLEVETMRDYLTTLKQVQEAVNGSDAEVRAMIAEYNAEESSSVRRLATFCVILKRELENLKQSKQKLKQDQLDLNRTISNLKREVNMKNEQIKTLEKDVKFLKTQPSPMTPQPISRVHCGEILTPQPISGDILTPQPISVETPKPIKTHHTNLKEVAHVLNYNDDKTDDQCSKRKMSNEDEPKKQYELILKKTKPVKKVKTDSAYFNAVQLNYNIFAKKSNSKSSVRIGYNGMGTHDKHIATTSSKNKPKHLR